MKTDQPTGEWTARYVNELRSCQRGDENQIVADAHNAALAAEKQKHLPYISDLERQLATERERPCAWCESEREEVLHQLSAHKQQAESMLATSKRVNDQFRSQMQTLVDALSRLSDECNPELSEHPKHECTGLIFCSAVKEIADAALAKAEPRSTRVKEGK